MASQRASSSTASARASPSPLSPPADSRPPPPPADSPPPPPPADSPPPPPRDVDHIVVIHQLMRELGPRLPSDRRDQLWHTLLQQQQQQQQHLQEEEEAGGSTVDQRPVTEDKEMPVPFADAPSPVRAVLNRPWPDPIVIPPASPSGKYRTLVATAKDIGPPITPEEFAALEDKEGDDLCTSHYKQAARADALMLNYIHEHGSLYMDEKNKFIFDNSILVEEIRCKYVTAEEMEANTMKRGNRSTYLPELALATYNKRRKVKFELCEQLLCRSFWEDRGFFWHLNFIVKRKGSKKLFFAEIEDCGQRSGEILQVCCCIPLDSLSEGGYYNWRSFSPSGPRKGLDLDRCYACTEFLKHPCDGLTYSGGHDYQRKTYLF